MTKNTFSFGLVLFALTMTVFFGVYFLGYNTHYFTTSLMVNAFVLPALYTLGAYYAVHTLKKQQPSFGFRTAFNRAFVPMFVGGLLSMWSIFAFLNYADPEAKRLLNYQFVERNKQELTEIYTKQKSILKDEKEKVELEKDYRKSMQSFSPQMVKDKDMFTFRQFTYYFAAVLIFYTILATFFGSFFRSRSL